MEKSNLFLREEKKQRLIQCADNMEQISSDLVAEMIIDGVILPVRSCSSENDILGKGGVLAKDGTFVMQSKIPGWIVDGYPCDHYEIDHRKAVYCGCMVWQWGHFLLESISRLWFFLDHPDEEYVYVFVAGEHENVALTGNYKEFFELLGISERIEILNTPKRFDSVIIPARSFQYRRFFSTQFIRVLDCVAAQADRKEKDTYVQSPKRVFLSRGRFPKAIATEIGLELLDHYFKKNGYTIVYPEQRSLAELIYLLRNAEICAAESGTVAHNFLFCKTKQQTIVVERTPILNDAQLSIDQIRELFTTYIDGNLALYTVSPGTGPFILYYTPCFKRFTIENEYAEPASEYGSGQYLSQCLLKYLNVYDADNSIKMEVHPLIRQNAGCIAEARRETNGCIARLFQPVVN